MRWLAFCIMAMTPIVALRLTPRLNWYDHIGRPEYQQVLPASFGNWQLLGDTPNALITPEQANIISSIYDQTLSRVYLHRPTGRRLVISLAHGLDQIYPHQMHWPEVCFPAQGFRILRSYKGSLAANGQVLNLSRMQSQRGAARQETTYWMRAGDRVTRGSLQLNLARIRLALHGYQADGLLVTVSEINADPGSAFGLEDHFISDLLSASNASARAAFFGSAFR